MPVVPAGVHHAGHFADDGALPLAVAGVFLHGEGINVGAQQHGGAGCLVSEEGQHAALRHVDMRSAHFGKLFADARHRALLLARELRVAVEFAAHGNDVLLIGFCKIKNAHAEDSFLC